MLVTTKRTAQLAYELYGELLNAGFTQAHALCIIGGFIQNLLMQDILQEHAESKRVFENGQK